MQFKNLPSYTGTHTSSFEVLSCSETVIFSVGSEQRVVRMTLGQTSSSASIGTAWKRTAVWFHHHTCPELLYHWN